MRRVYATFIFLIVATTVLPAQKPKTIKPGWNLFSQQQDVQLGKEAAAEIEKQVAVVDQRDLNEYVNRIGKKLAGQSEAGQYPYTFKVVYDKSINAFALPGGPSFVHTGLIQASDNEAQIAGVLAHEISHVALRHGTAQVTKAQAVQLLAGLGGAVMGGGMLGQLAQMGAGLGANSLLLKFSRSAESDADLLGARMMAKAGYDPNEMAKFFEKLEAQEKGSGQSIPQFLSDHPSPGNRVKAVSAEVKMMPAREYTRGDDTELRRIQGVIKGLPVPPKANTDFRGSKSGSVDTARPTAQLKQYQSRSLQFKYPGNWEVFENQKSQEITVASRDGILDVNGNAEIGYGAIVGLAATKAKVDLAKDTQAYLDQMLKANRTMKASGEQPKRLQINGANAMVNVMFSTSPYPNQREVDAIVTIEHPQGLLFMVLIAPEADYPKAQGVFDQMIQSVQFAR